jgi:rSAM/selenodomain-associated transferase 1
MTRRDLLMIAARAPNPGETKTRLGAVIGMEAAAELYRAFLRDLAATFDCNSGDRAWDLAWTHSPPEVDFRAELRAMTGREAPAVTVFVPQNGPDWGARQANLLRWGFQRRYERVVLMASDSPQLARGHIEDAFRQLERHDVVLGRVRDGGYYLVGMVGYHDVLTGVPMSTTSAADGVVQAAANQGLTVGETEPAFDIDEAPDLALLVDVLRRDPARCPETRRALVRLGLASGYQ